MAKAQLAKRLSPLGVWALSLGCIIGWGSFILPGTTFLPAAGPAGTLIALAIAVVVMLVVASNYSFLIGRFPLAGGEFAYVQKTFGTTHAFITSWLLGLCYVALVAQNATALALVGRSLLGSALQVGFHYTVAGYDVYAGELCVALAALVLFAALSIRGVHITGVFQTILVLAIVGGVGVVSLAALGLLGQQAFLCPQPAFSPKTEPFAGVLVVLAIAPFLFVGFDTVPQAAEEYHFPPGKTRALIALSLAFGALIYAALTLLAASGSPGGQGSWVAYMEPSLGQLGAAGIPTFHAARELLGVGGLTLLAFAACGAILSGIVGFYMASSRLLFALGREGVVPSWFAAVHPRYKTPHHALLFILVISAIAPFFGRTVLGWLVDMSALGAAVAYGYTSLVALHYARREGRKVQAAMGVLGGLFSLLFIGLLLVPIPGLGANLSTPAFICLLVWIVLGVIFFLVSRGRGKGGKHA